MRLLPDGFDSVDELYADDQLGQLVVSVEAAPTVLCRLGEFEDHGERRLVGEASLGSHGTVSHGGECAFDGVGGAQMLPMLGGKVVERQHRRAILDQACGRLVVFDGVVRIQGGTGMAIRIAQHYRIPVLNLATLDVREAMDWLDRIALTPECRDVEQESALASRFPDGRPSEARRPAPDKSDEDWWYANRERATQADQTKSVTRERSMHL